MRRLFLLLNACFMSTIAMGQTDSALAITYHSQAYISLNEDVLPYPDTVGMDAEDLTEELEMYEMLRAFALRQVDEANSLRDTSTYTLYNGRIRYKRTSYKLSEDEFRIIDLRERKSYTYYTVEGQPKKMWMWLHDEENNWEVEYQLDTFPEDRKEILGYDCYRMTIKEHRTWAAEGFDERMEYDLYVTDSLPLPFRAVGVFWRPITDLCALEAVVRDPRHPKSYSKLEAVRIQTDVSPSELVLPKQYHGLNE